ncbi:MAG: glycosyltransferase family 4 protein [Pseudomonadota bacterium]
MGRLIFVNRYFLPDESATSLMLAQLIEALTKAGLTPTVLCSRVVASGRSDGVIAANEVVSGATVERLWSTGFGGSSLFGKALDYLTFLFAVAWRLLRKARRGDVIVAKTDPPMLSTVCSFCASLRGATLVNWLQDVFPEVAQRMDVPLSTGLFGAVLLRLRNRAARRAWMNVCIGERMAAHLRAEGIPQITVIPNWAEPGIRPVPPSENSLRRAWGFGGRLVVGYSGNLGRAHEFETILDAAARVQALAGDRVAFLFIGGGHQRKRVAELAAERGLENIHFRRFQPRERLAESLSVPDIHLVSLRPQLEGLIVPSKFYGIVSAGRPVFFVGAPDGELGAIIRDVGCGAVFSVGEGAELAAEVMSALDDPEKLRDWSDAAMRLARGPLDRANSLDRWVSLLQSAVAG